MKFGLDILEKHKIVFIARVKEDNNGIEFNSYKQALLAFKKNYQDFIVLPVRKEDLLISLKNIEYYYNLYKRLLKSSNTKLIEKMKNILMKYQVIDNDNNLLINMSFFDKENLDKKEIIIKEKLIRKELELYDIFLKINCIE